MELKDWAERVIKLVSESGDCVDIIKLISTDGVPWETWYRNEFGTPEEWTERAERKVIELADDWPPTEIQLVFVAENRLGHVISQCTKRIRGRAKGAQSAFGNGPGKALADSMDAQARTMDRILSTAGQQIESLSNALSIAHQTNQALMQALQVERLAAQDAKPPIDPEVVQQALQMAPALFELLLNATKKAG